MHIERKYRMNNLTDRTIWECDNLKTLYRIFRRVSREYPNHALIIFNTEKMTVICERN